LARYKCPRPKRSNTVRAGKTGGQYQSSLELLNMTCDRQTCVDNNRQMMLEQIMKVSTALETKNLDMPTYNRMMSKGSDNNRQVMFEHIM